MHAGKRSHVVLDDNNEGVDDIVVIVEHPCFPRDIVSPHVARFIDLVAIFTIDLRTTLE
jgi:hypothetical protein